MNKRKQNNNIKENVEINIHKETKNIIRNKINSSINKLNSI